MKPSPAGLRLELPSDQRRRQRQTSIIRMICGLWICIVACYFAWEVISYRNLYALLAEWQFDQLGHYWPILTLSLLLALFAGPALFLLSRVGLRDRHPSGVRPIMAGNRLFQKILFTLSALFAAAAMVTWMFSWTLPRFADPSQHIVAGATSEQVIKSGAATVSGYVVYSRTSAFAQNLLFKRHGARFAPAISPIAKDGTIKLFVELEPSEVFPSDIARPVTTRNGVLLANGLPGSIVRLYRYAGYTVENPYYVLFSSELTMKLPYYIAAVQLLVIALMLLMAALLQRHHVHRTWAKLAQQKRRPVRLGS
ncbi:hypothetical protein KFK14_22295 [Sphingobium phenoxybenzoativorans]|uniref:Uncharacterized protein n=1 Tax=Sphingobium phenoxybenzoativorans TaxID=1592790 RepID=A0A975K6E5_9SPHN|nr:hypothetical protein [Sphingobium phenoxybenzoativorans]QUT05648.1 hypothetical protein KFK14_22295 [Sphingobium phenoxybenzoativorans]